MKRTAILHIGCEKTGTTSIQDFLRINRTKLAEAGFAVPEALGMGGDGLIHAVALDADREPAYFEALRNSTPSDRNSELLKLIANVKQEVSSLPPNVTQLVFSSELLHSRLTRQGEVFRLREVLGSICDDFRIIVYLRRQDEMAASHLSTLLRNGWANASAIPTVYDPLYFNFDRLLQRWGEVFGVHSLSVRLYDDAKEIRDGVVGDFMQQLGLRSGDYKPVHLKNASISRAGQMILRSANGRGSDTIRNNLRAFVEAACVGEGARPSPIEARQFVERFATANEAVRAKHFPNRKTLFSEVFIDNDGQAGELRAAQAAIESLLDYIERKASP